MNWNPTQVTEEEDPWAVESEPAIWLQEQEPLLKRLWDYINPMDLIQPTKQTYETTPEMQGASNLEVLDNLGMSFMSAAGGGDTNRFLKWEQEARNRGISPLMYAEPVAAALTIGLMALWGIPAAMQLISTSPTLSKVSTSVTSALARALPVGIPGGGMQPFYAGFPVEKSLSSAIQATSGLANVGQLQAALSKAIPGVPAVISGLISKAASGAITNQDIISLVGKEKAFKVSKVFGMQTGILEVRDEAGKLLRVEVEEEEVSIPEREVDIEIFRSITAPQGDELYKEWQTLIGEGEKERAGDLIKELESLKDQDSARYALIRIKKKGHWAPKEELFITKPEITPKAELPEALSQQEKIFKYVNEHPEKSPNEISKELGVSADIILDIQHSPEIFALDMKAQLETLPKVEVLGNPDYNMDLFGFQESNLEHLAKDMDNRFYGWLYEAAGDIFRELTGRPQVAGDYITEKTNRIAINWKLQAPEKPMVGKDLKLLDELVVGYKSLNVQTPRAKLAVDLIEAMSKGKDDKVFSLVEQINKSLPTTVSVTEGGITTFTEIAPKAEDGTVPEDVSKELSFRKSSDIIEPTENWLDWEVTTPMLPAPPVEGMLPPPEEMAALPEPKWEDFEVGLRAQIDSFEHFSMAYEEKTGIPLYSGVVRNIIEAGKSKTRDNRYFGKYVSQMFKGVSKDDMMDLTSYMKELQVRGIAEELPPELMTKVNEIRTLFDYGFVRFGVDPQEYIKDYIPLLSEGEKKRLDSIPISWKGIPDEVIPFFKHIRYALGEVIDAFTVEDLLRIYFNAGTWAEYRKSIADTKEASKNFPTVATNEVIKLDNFLTGGTTDFDKAFQTTTRSIIKKASKGRIDEESDTMTALVNAVYLGTISFNPGSAIKNLTQSFHNWSELDARWMAVGNKLYASKEGQDILKQSGIMMGYAPYAQRVVEKFYGEQAKLDKIIRGQSNLRNVGMYLFQTVDSYNRGTIYLAEWSRMNHFLDAYKKEDITLDELYSKCDFAGLHPTAQKMVKGMIAQKEWESAADFAADQRQAMTQWRYQREVRPQWMRSGAGKVAGQFLTWPTYGVVFHAGRYKRAAEAFGRGEKKEGLYQLWKELKWLAAVATTVYAGKKYGARLWPWFMFLPTQGLAAAQPIINLWSAAVNKAKGYDWIAGNKWRDFKYSAKIFVPGGVHIGNIYKAFEKGQPQRAFGIPMYPDEGVKKDHHEEWIKGLPTHEDWLKGE